MTSTEHHTTALNRTMVRTWFDVLYVNAPGLIHVSSTGNWTGQAFADYDQAANYAATLDKANPEGIYLRATTLKGKPGTGGRGSVADSLALPGLWADIDIAGPGHKHDVCPTDCEFKDKHVCVTRPLPPTQEDGQQIIAESGLPDPTLWVHSGGGLYPWWLLDKHVDITTDNLATIKELSARWQAVIVRSAAKLNWHYGPVGDLARILRIPGTINRKEGLERPCRIIEARPERYTLSQLRDGLAAALERHPDPQPIPAVSRRLEVVRQAGHITPNDDFEQRVDWDDQMLLGGAGWRIGSGQPGGYCEWIRPGKTTAGFSATTGKDPARDRLWVFSTDAGLPTEEPMTKPFVYALLNHGGDKKAATRELARRGFGTPLPPREKPTTPPAPRSIAPVDGTAARALQAVVDHGPTDMHAEMDKLATMPEADRQAHAREVIRQVAKLDAADRQTWRDTIRQLVPAITKGDFETIVREQRRTEKEMAKEAAAQHRQQRYAEQLQDPSTQSRQLPTPSDPMAVARALVARLPTTDGVPHTTWWRGDFYEWTGTRWAAQRDATVNRWLYLQTENAIFDSGQEFERWEPTIAKIGNLREAIGSAVLAQPWEDEDEKCVAVTNGVLDVSSRDLLAHTPRRFNLSSLPFAYDPDATCPKWLSFLAQVLPGDEEAQSFLGEWFGYVVSGRTDQQKIASLFGAKRSGKGTIARIMEALLGPEAVASVRLASLTGDFGEQPLIGKSLALLSDVNWNTRDVGEAVEIMKAISGEDSRDVNRKNREAWHGRLGVRFMAIGNDMPKFTDASGALAGRMIHVRFRVSFFGKENPNLTRELMDELPGILNWSLDGLDRLTERGRFKPPASSEESEREILRLTSPVYGFIDDHAVLDPAAPPVLLDDLFAVYREWCADEEGRDHISTKAVFARDLRSAGNGSIQVERKMLDGVRTQRVYGIAPAEPNGFTPKTRWLGGMA